MPPVIVNVPAVAGSPGWITPLVGFIGVLIGLIGNNLFTRAREHRQFHRDKKLELYLELQNGEYEIRRWLSLRDPVRPDWFDKNARWASLQLRMSLFASPRVKELGFKFWKEMHQWLVAASSATEGGLPGNKERKQIIAAGHAALLIHSELYEEIRMDLKVV
jgi:hypothetical protein